ncbi:hypothetical protein ACLB2K_045939 [Fragaria x ananassa]
MATFELYRRSTIGMCLTETLDEMVQNGTLSPELAIQVLVQFDKSMTEALETQVKSKVSIKAGSEAHVRTGLKVQTSLRWPPYDVGEGAPPPQQTPAAAPTTFPPRRVRRILVFRLDHPKLQTKSIWPENWNSADSPGMESGRGHCWSPLGWRRALAGAV